MNDLLRTGDAPIRDPLRDARRAVGGGRFREGLHLLEGAERNAMSTAEWLLLHAMATWRVGQFNDSHASAERALTAYRERMDLDGEMRTTNVAAAGAFALGQLTEARRGFERARELARQLDDTLMAARCANNIGNVAYYLGGTEDALTLYNQAANLFGQVGSLRGTAEAWHNMGVVLVEMRRPVDARVAADRALDIAARLDDDRILGWAVGGRAEVDAGLGDLRLAEVHAQRSRDLAREHDDPLTEVDALRVLAVVSRLDGQAAEAVARARIAVVHAVSAGNPFVIAKCQVELGECEAAAGDAVQAARTWKEAADGYQAIGAARRVQALRQRGRD
jgi:tetratricopeptide (TPR) repeat protein